MTEKDKLEAAYALGSLDEVRALYRTWAETYETDFADAGGFRMPKLVADAFLAMGGTGPVLDAGCGTGLVADLLPEDLAIDGADISPDMLRVAARKGRYRALHEVDLTAPLPFADGAYGGLVSSGTFTHGHVGPEALTELLRVLAPGGTAAITTNAIYMEKTGFGAALDGHAASGLITGVSRTEERIYARPDGAPRGHGDDMGFVITFRRA